jgi:hypothetical protein
MTHRGESDGVQFPGIKFSNVIHSNEMKRSITIVTEGETGSEKDFTGAEKLIQTQLGMIIFGILNTYAKQSCKSGRCNYHICQ